MCKQMPPWCEPLPEPTVVEKICHFNKLTPPKFWAGLDPLTYEEFLKRIENLFEIKECPNRFKVRLLTYKLEKMAEFWRGTIEPWAGELTLTWEQLKTLMDAQFYPWDVRRAKEQDFLCIKQGNTSVKEYAAKFNELSHFAPNQVATEEMRIDYFEQGLKGRQSKW